MNQPESGSNDPAAGESQAAPQAGVLGNLPRSRPAVRSPRRKDAPDPAADAARAAAETRPPEKERDAAAGGEAGAGGNDIEALARTGIAVATGAAALGLRAAGRAAAAVRDAVERR